MRSGAVGDFIFTLPVLGALREANPAAHVEVMGHPEMLSLVAGRYYADGVSSIDRAEVATLFSRRAAVAPSLAERLARCDLVLAYLTDADGMLRSSLESVCRGRIEIFSPVLPGAPPSHIVDHLLTPLKCLGIPVSERTPRLRLLAEDRAAGERLLAERGVDCTRPLLAIHPGAGSAAKRWPAEQFARLIDRVVERTAVVLVSGPADTEVTDEVLDLCEHRDEPVVLRDQPLLVVAQALGCCDAFAGNDSGITHMAAALDVPTVAIYGETDPARWAPRGERVYVMRAPDRKMAAVSLEKVHAAVNAALSNSGARQESV